MIIDIKNLNKSYKNGSVLHVLKGVNLSIEKGEMVALMGASGSGKSTLLNIIGLLDTFDSGTYELDGLPMHHLEDQQAAIIRNQKIGFVFQSFNLISYKTTLENVALPLLYKGIPRKKRFDMAYEYLDMVGLSEWSSHFPTELSGGQRQRVAIARALITHPDVILADEPTGALDSKMTQDIMQLMKKINREGITMLIVTHEQSVASFADRVVKMRDGELMYSL
ncbi:putative ABC transport system ATP-binding protein [Xylanibacter ruminicola]|uniref:Putative ABC transport system ATP-binding protein n=1 Tax=Xylanibacter ruminicola TaxID=839 RepID=A0A1H3Y5D1_XYLRU|nr:ABC transporter ATP-binding protein [Xylanibacter ruminicola]SEA06042.1 putative ABC transport system ATP-binding protein [Xylanibacter ruminicola]